jgi:hypothetical protein
MSESNASQANAQAGDTSASATSAATAPQLERQDQSSINMSESNASQANAQTGDTSASTTSASTIVNIYTWIDVWDTDRDHCNLGASGAVSTSGSDIDWLNWDSFGKKIKPPYSVDPAKRYLSYDRRQLVREAESKWRDIVLNSTKETWAESGRTESVKFVLKTKAQYDEDQAKSEDAS